jgi:multicomponent Na+:H+ antiporter subunit E
MKFAAKSIVRILSLLMLFVSAWLLWSGLFKPLLLGLGAFSCLLVTYLTHRLGYTDHENFRVNLNLRFLGYWAWLGKEIVRSNIEVARVILDPRLPISPRIVEIEATARHPVDQVILGNSITLTPGTIALDVQDGMLKVHTLTQEGADVLMSGEMDRRIASLRAD